MIGLIPGPKKVPHSQISISQSLSKQASEIFEEEDPNVSFDTYLRDSPVEK